LTATAASSTRPSSIASNTPRITRAAWANCSALSTGSIFGLGACARSGIAAAAATSSAFPDGATKGFPRRSPSVSSLTNETAPSSSTST